MPDVIIYGASIDDYTALTHILRNGDIDVVQPKGETVYEQERSFVYGLEGKGHQVALIVFGNTPISFGVLSQDIITKQLPIVIYLKNETAKAQFEDFKRFLFETNIKMKEMINVDSFSFEKANYNIVLRDQVDSSSALIASIKQTYERYFSQTPDKRKTRKEALQVSDHDLQEVRQIFSIKPGFGAESMITSPAQFKDKLSLSKRPSAAYFGPIFKPKTDMCRWAEHLSRFNLIYGLGGADIEKPFDDQSTMYQFSFNAAKAGASVFGVIPHAQTEWEKNRDFSSLDLKGCYITNNLAERMAAFAESDLIIVGSCGTGTYEEVLDILRFNPDKPVWIIDNDGSTSSLINYLSSCVIDGKKCFSNLTVIRNQIDFERNVKLFEWNSASSTRPNKSGLWSPPSMDEVFISSESAPSPFNR